jgi:chemotaxis family two-component system sensor kinase Cph1
LRVPQPLPSVVCDPIRVREVFVNLLSNALKFNDKPSRWIEVGWSDIKPPVFWVRDNGIGIAEEHQEDIFRIFRWLHGRDEMGGRLWGGINNSQEDPGTPRWQNLGGKRSGLWLDLKTMK